MKIIYEHKGTVKKWNGEMPHSIIPFFQPSPFLNPLPLPNV
jgi:hypothetical protein